MVFFKPYPLPTVEDLVNRMRNTEPDFAASVKRGRGLFAGRKWAILHAKASQLHAMAETVRERYRATDPAPIRWSDLPLAVTHFVNSLQLENGWRNVTRDLFQTMNPDRPVWDEEAAKSWIWYEDSVQIAQPSDTFPHGVAGFIEGALRLWWEMEDYILSDSDDLYPEPGAKAGE